MTLHTNAAAILHREPLRLIRTHGLRPSLGARGYTCTCGNGAGECRHPGAHPVARAFQTAATGNPATVEGWGMEHAAENVGVLCGGPAGLVVIEIADFDRYHELRRLLGGLPPSWVSRAPSGSVSRWYRTTPRAAKAAPEVLRAGLTVHAAGSWVALPGSRDSEGEYQWMVGPDAGGLGRLPRAWADAIHRAGFQSHASRCSPGDELRAAAAKDHRHKQHEDDIRRRPILPP